MYKAYEIVGGWHSLCGDVPATMLAFGISDDVSEYCGKTIKRRPFYLVGGLFFDSNPLPCSICIAIISQARTAGARRVLCGTLQQPV